MNDALDTDEPDTDGDYDDDAYNDTDNDYDSTYSKNFSYAFIKHNQYFKNAPNTKKL